GGVADRHRYREDRRGRHGAVRRRTGTATGGRGARGDPYPLAARPRRRGAREPAVAQPAIAPRRAASGLRNAVTKEDVALRTSVPRERSERQHLRSHSSPRRWRSWRRASARIAAPSASERRSFTYARWVLYGSACG